MPEMVKAIAISSGKDINYDKHLKGGKTWEYHANEKVSYVFVIFTLYSYLIYFYCIFIGVIYLTI